MKKKAPYVVGIVNPKGGVGKSTLCIQLAIAFSKLTKLRVLIVDLDDQGSAMNWFDVYRDDPKDRISTVHLAAKFLNKQLSKVSQGYDIILLDSKGSRDKAIGDRVSIQAIENSDFTVIPIVPTALDDLAGNDFVDDVIAPLAAESDLKMALLLSKTTRSMTSKAFRKAYRDHECIPAFETEIPDCKQYDNAIAHGLACFEFLPKHKKTEEFLNFFRELCSQIGVKYGKTTSSEKKKPVSRRRSNSTKDCSL